MSCIHRWRFAFEQTVLEGLRSSTKILLPLFISVFGSGRGLLRCSFSYVSRRQGSKEKSEVYHVVKYLWQLPEGGGGSREWVRKCCKIILKDFANFFSATFFSHDSLLCPRAPHYLQPTVDVLDENSAVSLRFLGHSSSIVISQILFFPPLNVLP